MENNINSNHRINMLYIPSQISRTKIRIRKMCRIHQIRYVSCWHDGDFEQEILCADRPDCIEETITQVSSCFCNACMLSPNLERRREDHNYLISDDERAAARSILTRMAAPPGQRYVQFGGELEIQYDAENIHQFDDRVSRADGLFLRTIEYTMYALIWEMLLDADSPDPTQNEIRLYLQIRDASQVAFNHEMEDHRLGIEPPEPSDNHQQEIIRRLGHILTDVPIPVNDPECPYCLEDYGQGEVPEMPVQLPPPCLHIYGRACLEAWVTSFVPGSEEEFTVCTLCRDGFGILTGWEEAAGIVVPEAEDMPWWIRNFRDVWPQDWPRED